MSFFYYTFGLIRMVLLNIQNFLDWIKDLR